MFYNIRFVICTLIISSVQFFAAIFVYAATWRHGSLTALAAGACLRRVVLGCVVSRNRKCRKARCVT